MENKSSLKPEMKLKKKIRKLNKKQPDEKNSNTESRGVVLVKHIPHGFYEPQMKKYFEQFGKVTRLRLSRSKKTGGSRGYAYVEFENEEVAKIVADAMKDYLMFRRRLMCKFIPKSELHPATFRRWNIPFRKPIRHLKAIKIHNSMPDEKAANKSLKRLKMKNNKRLGKLKKLEINYQMPSNDDK